MSESSHILHAYAFDGKGGAEILREKDISARLRDQELAWVHLDASHPETPHWLAREVDYLDSLAIEALLAEETRPRFQQMEHGAILILRGANLNESSRPEDMISIRIWVDRHRIISMRIRTLRSIRQMEDALKEGRGAKDSGDFITMLIGRLIENCETVFSQMKDNMDRLEENVLDFASAIQREEIVNLRKQAIIFRRYIAPQREVVSQLRASDLRWLNGQHKRQLQEHSNHITRHLEDLDAVRERSQIVQDELNNELTAKTNKNLYILSIISAIFIPLSFLTGLFGINIGGIPGTHSDFAFAIFSAIVLGLLVMELVIFRKLKWF